MSLSSALPSGEEKQFFEVWSLDSKFLVEPPIIYVITFVCVFVSSCFMPDNLSPHWDSVWNNSKNNLGFRSLLRLPTNEHSVNHDSKMTF